MTASLANLRHLPLFANDHRANEAKKELTLLETQMVQTLLGRRSFNSMAKAPRIIGLRAGSHGNMVLSVAIIDQYCTE